MALSAKRFFSQEKNLLLIENDKNSNNEIPILNISNTRNTTDDNYIFNNVKNTKHDSDNIRETMCSLLESSSVNPSYTIFNFNLNDDKNLSDTFYKVGHITNCNNPLKSHTRDDTKIIYCDYDVTTNTTDNGPDNRSISENGKFISRYGSLSVKRHFIPRNDSIARERCFEYIVQAIDEVWARYYDITSLAEVKFYNHKRSTSMNNIGSIFESVKTKTFNLTGNDYGNILLSKRRKLANGNLILLSTNLYNASTNNIKHKYKTGDNGDNNNIHKNNDKTYGSPDIRATYVKQADYRTNYSTNSDSDDIYLVSSNATNSHEQRDDEDNHNAFRSESTIYKSDSSDYYTKLTTVSKLPDSIKLQSLKLRLIRAKNYLDYYSNSLSLEDSIKFWHRWDMIKYSTVEIMEDDDDDEVVENVIDELEEGRFFGV